VRNHLKPAILIVIPARGDSKGIPRKNIRSMNGKPLISYAIQTAKKSIYQADIVVSSDDAEINSMAQKFNAQTINRNKALAQDATTLDPVIYDAFQQAQSINDKKYDLIITMQPTSPLLEVNSLDKAIKEMLDNAEIETILSAIDDRHLCWTTENDKFVPAYEARVNRQYLPAKFRETGSFLITRSTIISENNRIGKNVSLAILSPEEAIDIDTYQDWNLCEYLLRKKKILFVLTGYNEVGLGHIYRGLLLANEILDHEIHFLVDAKSQLGYDVIAAKNYPVSIQKEANIIDDIKQLDPDLVINDILDTDAQYMQALKKADFKSITFEDLGEGRQYADLVINAMYTPVDKETSKNHYYGHHYFCIRTEFLLTPKKKLTKEVKRVLLSFGGVDPNDFTMKVLDAIYEYGAASSIVIDVIAGMGYKNSEALSRFEKINFYRNVSNMSDFMLKADIAFTSGGRTTYELGALGIPTIVLCQNERETTHVFACAENGFLNLGLGYHVSNEKILETFQHLVTSFEAREQAHRLMLKQDIEGGKHRVVNLIKAIIQN